MRFEEALDHLGEKLGAGQLRPGPDGRCRLDFAKGFSVELFVPGRNRLHAETLLRRLPPRPEDALPVLRETLSRSVAWLKEGPHSLALDKEQGRLVLFRTFDLDGLEVLDLDRGMAAFLAQVEAWQDRKDPVTAPQPAMLTIFP